MILQLNSTCPPCPPRPPPVPIWTPGEYRAVDPPVAPPPLPQRPHLLAVMAKYYPHRPPLKPFIDALRLEGRSEEHIKRIRDAYARHRRDSEKEQAKIDKIFGKYNTKATTKAPKKVLKILKKK